MNSIDAGSIDAAGGGRMENCSGQRVCARYSLSLVRLMTEAATLTNLSVVSRAWGLLLALKTATDIPAVANSSIWGLHLARSGIRLDVGPSQTTDFRAFAFV